MITTRSWSRRSPTAWPRRLREYLHARVRREWGYAPDERIGHDDLVAENYRGIRPAFGYPACPDHSEKFKLFDLLGARDVGIELTESAAMMPAASVSGVYFAHPESRYFSVGRMRARSDRAIRGAEGRVTG